MDLRINGVYNTSTPKTEYLQLEVLNQADLKDYMVSDTTYIGPNTVSNKHRHGFWFNSQVVLKGDIIRLYTGTGTNSSKKFASGHTEYSIYWNLKQCVWNNTGDGVLLFKIAGLSGKKVL